MAGPISFTQALAGVRANPNRKLSVGEIMSQRERGPQNSGVIDPRTGIRLTKDQAWAQMPQGGYQVNLQGSAGYGGGRSRISGYSGINQGTGADYIRTHGGLSPRRPSLLNELYRNQPGVTMGAFDALQSQAAMDRQDPIGGFYADQAGVAQGQGAYDKAQLMHDLLTDHLAQRGASRSTAAGMPADATSGAMGGAVAGQGAAAPYHAPGETRFDSAGNLWRWNQNSGHGDMIQRGPSMSTGGPSRGTTWEPSENLGEGTLHTPYGTASVTQGSRPSAGLQGTFTNGHGSRMGGTNFTGRLGRQSASAFFQEEANRQGMPNKYAVPEPGYGGKPYTDSAWQSYNSAMKAKNLLGKR